MIRPQYIEPDIVSIYRDDALVAVEVRTEDAGVIVDARSFARGRAIPQLGDSVRLPQSEGTWGRASFVPPGKSSSLTDPSDLIVTGHAGRRIVTAKSRLTGTITKWEAGGVKALMDAGGERSFPPFFHPNPQERGWDLLMRSASCRRCRRTVSIYTPMLICGSCADKEGLE